MKSPTRNIEPEGAFNRLTPEEKKIAMGFMRYFTEMRHSANDTLSIAKDEIIKKSLLALRAEVLAQIATIRTMPCIEDIIKRKILDTIAVFLIGHRP